MVSPPPPFLPSVSSPPYLQLDEGESAVDVFINDDPMTVLMEYMRIQVKLNLL